MHNTNVLRIGNWVSVNGKDITVESICADGINMDESGEATCYVQHINEIPLTEEWLKKFGFNDESKTTPAFYILGNVPIRYQHNCFFYDLGIDGKHRQIEYVHQLQNLCFALNGRDPLYRVEYTLTYKNPNQLLRHELQDQFEEETGVEYDEDKPNPLASISYVQWLEKRILDPVNNGN